MESIIATDEYTGDALKQYINNSNVDKLQNRDFINAILEYSKSNENRVLSISGLRGTGKTTGVLQAISKINKFDDTVLINIDSAASMTCLDLRNIILNKYKNKKYIFIDEITRVRDLINNSSFLADNLCMNGKKVIISGTDSLALVKSKYAGLYHRCININVTHINFAEAKRTASQSLKDYIEMGGLYAADTISDIEGLRDYIDTAVVANIMNTITKNKGVTSLLNLDGISERKLRTIVFRIIYAIVYMNTQKIRPTSVKFMIDLYDYSTSNLYNAKNLNTLVCSQMKIDETINTNMQEVGSVLDALRELGLVIKIENIFNKSECSYYISNPSIVNQLLKSIVDIIDTTNLNKRTNINIKRKSGLIFESIVVAHTKKVADKLGNNVYYYHDNADAEIDLIVERVTGNAFEDLYLYYEIKMTQDSDLAVAKSKWINSSQVQLPSSNYKVIAKSIIYGGQSKQFNGFNSVIRSVTPAEMRRLEVQNNGIQLINAEDYLLHTKDKLKILDEIEQ